MWEEIKKSLEQQMLLLSKRLNEEKDPHSVLALACALAELNRIIYQ